MLTDPDPRRFAYVARCRYCGTATTIDQRSGLYRKIRDCEPNIKTPARKRPRRLLGIQLRLGSRGAGSRDRSAGGPAAAREAHPSVKRSRSPDGRHEVADGRRVGVALLELDGSPRLLEFLLELGGLLAVDALLDRLGGLVDERLGLFQAEAGGRADDLDDLDLLVACAGQEHVDGACFLLLGRGTVAARASGSRDGRGHGGRRHAELLLERLDALGELEHRGALQLLDPLLCGGCCHVRQSSWVEFASASSG